MKVSVIVPCYNEEEVIEKTYEEIKKVMIDNKYDYEIIFVNDGSKDKTLDILRSISDKDDKVVVISFSRNFGHQPAVSAGIKHSSGDVAVIIDADLQDPPQLIPEMIKIHKEQEANVVYGVRKERKGEGFFKKFTAKLFYRLLNTMSDIKFPLDTGDFRLIDKKVIEEFRKLKERDKYIRGLISWMGFKQVPIYYDRNPRFAGVTKYPLKKMIKFALTGIFYFSDKPLKMVTSLGFITTILGLFLGTYVILSKLINPSQTISGWASTMITIIFLGGVQLLTLGVIGKYIANIFDEIKGRPEYIVDEIISKKQKIGF
ncbi:MAG: glycosyltransferase family 2 protein [Brevinematales bacterium]|nr:glycosyltransferase family 2 protein [Brevinematales bacterium]